MFWTNAWMEVAVAMGIGFLTFGLLARYKRNRMLALRAGHKFVESPQGSGIKTPQPLHAGNDSKLARISVRPSGILMCDERRSKPREAGSRYSREAHRAEVHPAPLPKGERFPIQYIPWTPPVPHQRAAEKEPPAKFAAAAAAAGAGDSFITNNMASRIYAAQQRASEEGIKASRAPRPSATVESTAAGLLKFYGLKKQAFDVTPDPEFLYPAPSHREAQNALAQGIEHFRGILTLIAEPGMGKTVLLNQLIEDLNGKARVIFLFQSQYNSRELLGYILDELEVEQAGMDVVAMHRALHQALLEEMLRGRRFVLILDEAQNLQEPELETVRLLSDYETTQSKLIQIILAGQPQLAETLAKPGLAQLRQRVASISQLQPLSAKETAEYIAHRLRSAGGNGFTIFTREALAKIAELSKGVPRNINNLCFNALFIGFQLREEIIDAGMIRKAADKLGFSR